MRFNRFDEPDYYEEPEFVCSACEDQGLMETPAGVEPCSECSAPVTLDDLLEYTLIAVE